MSELDEINKTRIAAGLQPIPVPGSSAADNGSGEDGQGMQVDEDPDVVAQRNYQERMEQDRKERETKELQERIAKAKNQRALKAKLKGSTLGEEDPSGSSADQSTLAWLKASKKKQKQIAAQLAQAKAREEEEKERELQAVYGADDLKGMKVAHRTKDLDKAGGEMILTLKDSRILNDEEDELQNVDLADEDRRRAGEVRKKRAKQGYTGYDDDEFGAGSDEDLAGVGRNVLTKYDDDYEGEGLKREGFRLGGASPPPESKKRKAEDSGPGAMVSGSMGIIDDDDIPHSSEASTSKVNRQLLNLDYTKNFEVSDYATEDTTFKKKKKKTKRNIRRADVGQEDQTNPDGGEVQMTPLNREVGDNLVGDDDLQFALSRQRKQSMMKRGKRMRVDDLVAQVNETREASEEGSEVKLEPGLKEEENDGLTFDDTTEFIRNVTLDSLVKREPVARPIASSSTAAAPAAGIQLPDGVTVKQEPGEEPDRIRVKIETTDDDQPLGGLEVTQQDDVNMEDGELSEEDSDLAEMALRQGLSIEEMRLKMDAELGGVKKEDAEDVMVSKPEPTVAGGVAGALALLRQQGALKETTSETKERERTQKERDLWLADHRRRIAKRELEKAKLRGGAVRDQAQREWEIKTREQQEARDALQAYANYKPDIKIEYTDEFGRIMTPLEAWKSLSHKFHGKTSGRKKTELRLRRVEEERKREAMVAGDTPSGMLQAFARRQEATGEAYMTLSVGNRKSVSAFPLRYLDV
ncbi:SART-1 protein [Filobasidium floriforme]|uniref:SART-1 protein n=1 Tax=Filobasidium floriforme TaxID=5210 RepID=UPI001E8E2D38|nr:SART-1 protein [Filobasidium floriforme]KAH8088177.1 SART-1 protein [Filobasidium floriforme]